MIARFMFAIVDFAARKGLAGAKSAGASEASPKLQAHRTGVRDVRLLASSPRRLHNLAIRRRRN
jgi:hypothetical protein